MTIIERLEGYCYGQIGKLELVESRQAVPDVSDVPDELSPLTAQSIRYVSTALSGSVADAKGNSNSARLAYGFARNLNERSREF